MTDDLVAQLDALGEDDFYYSPATTKAKINEAKAALKSQSARIAELKALVYGLMIAMSASGDDFADILKEARAKLSGGEDG